MSNIKPKWATEGDTRNNDLNSVLSFAVTSYGKQYDWFLRHKETGIKHLAVVLTAELAITSLAFTKGFPFGFAIAALILLAILSPFLCISAIGNCKRSYQASLENALLMTKTLWAMGFAEKILVEKKVLDSEKSPVCKDETFYIPRHVKDAYKKDDTYSFVDYNLGKKKTTYYWAKLTVIIIGIMGFIIGIIAATAIYLHYIAP